MNEDAWIDESIEGKRPCPVCGNRMHIEKKNRISIDVCPDHGIWLANPASQCLADLLGIDAPW